MTDVNVKPGGSMSARDEAIDEAIRSINAIRQLHWDYGRDITEYEADLNAARGRADTLAEELRKANTSWAAASRELVELRGQLSRIRVAFDELRKAVYPSLVAPTGTILDGVIDPVKAPSAPWMLTLKDGFEPLPAPWMFTLKDGFEQLPAASPYMGSNYNPDLEDKVDRLHEAGYSCATGKGKAEAKMATESYSGLV